MNNSTVETLRFFSLFALCIAIGFFAVRWLIEGGANQLPVFHTVDVNSPKAKYEASSASDNDAKRDELRQAVLSAANDLAKNPCDSVYLIRYVQAATDYARAWLAIVPCFANDTCTNADSKRIDLVQTRFGTPLDNRVKEAMARAHAARTLKASDFPPDTVSLLVSLAADTTLMSNQPGERLQSRFGPTGGCRS